MRFASVTLINYVNQRRYMISRRAINVYEPIFFSPSPKYSKVAIFFIYQMFVIRTRKRRMHTDPKAPFHQYVCVCVCVYSLEVLKWISFWRLKSHS